MFKKTIGAVALMMIFALNIQEALAQSDEGSFEVGGQFSRIRLPILTGATTIFPCINPPCPVMTSVAAGCETEPGFGGRLGYSFSRHVGVEAEANFFLRNRHLEGGRKTQGLFGAKVGKRFATVGLFAKARPGLVRFSKGDYQQVGACIAVFPPPIGCFEPTDKTNFAFDLGGVVEWYPSKHTIVRLDAGDTIIRFGNRNVAARDVSTAGLDLRRLVVIPVAADTTHNFQGSLGIGWRF